MKIIYYLSQLLVYILISGNFVIAKEHKAIPILNEDKKANAVMDGKEISLEGSLSELFKLNEVKVSLKAPFYRKQIFEALNIDEKKIELIYDSTCNGFCISRFRFSKSYDIIIRSFVSSPKTGALKSATLSFVPHVEAEYGTYLVNQQKRDNLLFFKNDLWVRKEKLTK